MLTQEQQEQFGDIFDELGKSLDITEAEYDAAVRSYSAVGAHLVKEDSPLAPYSPDVLPQGSIIIGTITRTVDPKDELDLDLVCQLTGKAPHWTQQDLKRIVGDQLKAHGTYARMIKEPEGRRCWTLEYAEAAKYHMDILPSIVDRGYRLVLERAFVAQSHSDVSETDVSGLAIRITDRELANYATDPNHLQWLKSNPFGYARWFLGRAALNTGQVKALMEAAVAPVPKYTKDKLPLQRVVQILKRHRDIMFKGHEKKPISVIITTLAARAYNKDVNVLTALRNVIPGMRNEIKERFDTKAGRFVKWISNPTNSEENFADRWVNDPERQEKFYEWLASVESDVNSVLAVRDYGMQRITEELKRPFGEPAAMSAMNAYGARMHEHAKARALKMAAGTGTLSSVGSIPVPKHNFYGQEE